MTMPYSALQLAEAFIKTGELADALDALNSHLTQSPQDADARRMRAAVCLRLGQFQQALDDLNQLNTPQDRLMCSTVYERMGELEQALNVLADDAEDRLIERRLYLLQQLGRVAAARVISDDQPRTWRWCQWSGDLAVAAEDYPAAVMHYTQALNTLPPQSSQALQGIAARLLLARGAAYLVMQRWDDAEADYVAAEQIIPDDPIIVFNRGVIRYHRGERQGGLAQCYQAIEAAPAAMRPAMQAALPE
ncbi:MAG: hypothetical protein CUN56_02150 [Phototrophicales bacterium]|nr:MAG: hypothetical protein CUN56_02150 [Phototrophicales bacterium]